MRCQVVLEIEYADQLGLLDQGQTQHRTRVCLRTYASAANGFGAEASSRITLCCVRITVWSTDSGSSAGVTSACRSVTSTPAASVVASASICSVVAVEKNEQAPLGAGMFERDRHQGFNEPIEHDLAGNGLRRLHHRAQLQLLDGSANGADGRQRRRIIAEPRVRLLELPDFSLGAPAQITEARVPQISLAIVSTPRAA